MSNITVESVLRHQAWAAVSHLEGLRGLVDGLKRLVGLSAIQEGQEEWRTSLLPPVRHAEQMAMLREIAQEMEQLTSAIGMIGGQVPSRAIPYCSIPQTRACWTLGKRIILYPIFLISCSIRYRMMSSSFFKREAKSVLQILDRHRHGCQGFHKNIQCKRCEGGEYLWKQTFKAHLDE
jgi:hypothetical protein